jgi:sulfate permease, SulP family
MRSRWAADAGAALAVTFLAVPQGIAYALIAGLPPVAGLYASTIPVIVGSLVRSSRHVITGPTNALSLLVGGGVVAASGADPWAAAMVLAVMIGTAQVAAGALRLGVLVDFISNPVVLGYITGAGLLIGVGQLHNLTGTVGGTGDVASRVWAWLSGLAHTQPLALALAGGTALVIVLLPRLRATWPAESLALAGATAVSWAFALPDHGVVVLGDLAAVPRGLPPFVVPDFDVALMRGLAGVAVAGTVLSLVESSSVGRSIALQTGQRLDLDREFVGQGMANIAAGFCGGYPTSGSLVRSSVSHRSGAQTRAAGVMTGLAMIGVLLALGPVVNHTPVAALAGMLLVVAARLVDPVRIRRVLRGRRGDAFAFAGTLGATWVLALDQAILVGVAFSLVYFLRRVRYLVIRELIPDASGVLREVRMGSELRACAAVQIMHVEGQLFFAAAGTLESALADAAADPELKVLILRLKRTQGLDHTTAEMLAGVASRLADRGQQLLLVGLRERPLGFLRAAGVEARLGGEQVFPTTGRSFGAMDEAITAAMEAAAAQHAGDLSALENYLSARPVTSA